jgi:ferric-dicitrate binding protein FerR (iron transport regulator)
MPDKDTGIEELLSNESFLAWYFRTDTSAIDHWEEWRMAHPANTELAAQAVEFLSSLHLQERPMKEEQRTLAIRRLLEKLKQTDRRPLYARIPARLRWMAAASLLILTAAIYYLSSLPARKSSWSTTYGEVKNTRLPDGTEILANANTHLTYMDNWVDGKDREVWLKGEAFFHVRKTTLQSRFIVHLEQVDIIVTGTRFNVVNRPGKSNILLSEGSVTLRQPDQKDQKMLPGDFVELVDGRLNKRAVKADSCLGWKDKRIFLDNTPLSQLIKIIHEQYGVDVEPADTPSESRTLSGILANDNLDVLLRALELTGDFKIIRDKDKIIIKEHQDIKEH